MEGCSKVLYCVIEALVFWLGFLVVQCAAWSTTRSTYDDSFDAELVPTAIELP